MKTDCKETRINFQSLNRREIVGKFDGGHITSDGGAILLKEVEERLGILKEFSECFVDHRHQDSIEHTVLELVSQRIYGLVLGYEDLNDHDQLRCDHLLSVLVGKSDLKGKQRKNPRDQGKPMAGKSTLNRLELGGSQFDEQESYKKIILDFDKVDQLLLQTFTASYEKAPKEIVIDADATDHQLFGSQEGRFFHGYYDEYCYLPLYFFCGDHLLRVRLNEADVDPGHQTLVEFKEIVRCLRETWPEVRIIFRGDAGFCRDELLSFCEESEEIYYAIGMGQNKRLNGHVAGEMDLAKKQFEQTNEASRFFRSFEYQTLKSWDKPRRIVGKAEYLLKGENHRFVVTNLKSDNYPAKELYEDFYCARGDMENRLKEQQLGLFADRNSTQKLRSNQIRVYLSSIAYCLMRAFREYGLSNTIFKSAQCLTIRLKIFKVAAKIKVSVRKIWISFSEAYPYQNVFFQIKRNLKCMPMRN